MQRCARCNRPLSNPHSIARSLGPVCYRKSGGGAFDNDLNASEKEWARREEILKSGAEIDFGVHWQYPLSDGIIAHMRISVRYSNGVFEAYAQIYDPRKYFSCAFTSDEQIIIARSENLKEVYKEAIAAGPTYSAMAYREERNRKKKRTEK
ncbi:hypothetical protein TthWC1_2281 [Thermoanaerobacter thermohydrosulfuricus WC1]|uniref:Uncharacterized protein n=1 Tax=Thermoanaerobacter thermohydrosulfuricus WC1 TaxID=1198630 RepID=M8CLX5_THETY|nr:DUF6011 domain-containing protein [Thermoanaerobacter thermohydrosulfuricus]EMT38215.1 hypothetical protein TthWC1_2281 [Thermoanaerobacter thermohydrosulfuricus WC1]